MFDVSKIKKSKSEDKDFIIFSNLKVKEVYKKLEAKRNSNKETGKNKKCTNEGIHKYNSKRNIRNR